MDNNFGMHTKIVGVTRKNDDGTDRQNLIADLSEGDQLTFEREYENEHDENAIAVYDCSGQQLGYLKSSVAEDVAPILDSGGKITGFVTEVTGGMGDESYGCNIRIEVFQNKNDSNHVDIGGYSATVSSSNSGISVMFNPSPKSDDKSTPRSHLCGQCLTRDAAHGFEICPSCARSRRGFFVQNLYKFGIVSAFLITLGFRWPLVFIFAIIPCFLTYKFSLAPLHGLNAVIRAGNDNPPSLSPHLVFVIICGAICGWCIVSLFSKLL